MEDVADVMPSEAVRAFLRSCGGAGPLDAMARLQADLAEANRSMNLTRVADFWVGHVADSLAVGLAVPELLSEAMTVADVGCGAGFPLLPLAWANAELWAVGFESRQKKADFVAREVGRLGLSNASVEPRRAREAARLEEHAGRYDAVLLRAVGPAGELVRECRGLLKPGGVLIHYKTPQAVQAELPLAEREANKYGFTIATSDVIELPEGGGARQFLLMHRR
ncbi:16S rRNA (guanine(527)-N(7))-methyltransferase RsmG [bacterium]|nr:16S rRNA (guanine(527)-N(7))-methyltransferase RsmG [bacterium]